ncbi:MAG: redox-regulated ATPase YchF [Planctomycetes bacterium]|nr:redox-regulated ATPase YchF [Planctomycetota bacterium]
MALSCGIVGLPNVGKSTIFSALTSAQAERGNYPFCTIEPNVAVVDVPDPVLPTLRRHISSEKIIPASCRIVDIAGLIEGASRGEGMGNQFLANIRECDAIMQVVRCFESTVVLREGAVNPAKDMGLIETELMLADLQTLEKTLERSGRAAKSGDKDAIVFDGAVRRAAEALNAGTLLRAVDWKLTEREALKPLCLMTMKPMLYVANVADDDCAGTSKHSLAVAEQAALSHAEWLPICGDMECELRTLDESERGAFMEQLGMTEPGLDRLVRSVYRLLGLQTYYTAGPKEIRAWTIPSGATAPEAAGVIHTDFEKGFIRAQIYSVADIEELGDEATIKASGRLRTEGRDYRMREGDVCHFLTNR